MNIIVHILYAKKLLYINKLWSKIKLTEYVYLVHSGQSSSGFSSMVPFCNDLVGSFITSPSSELYKSFLVSNGTNLSASSIKENRQLPFTKSLSTRLTR